MNVLVRQQKNLIVYVLFPCVNFFLCLSCDICFLLLFFLTSICELFVVMVKKKKLIPGHVIMYEDVFLPFQFLKACYVQVKMGIITVIYDLCL